MVPRYNFGPLQGYVEKNGVAPAKLDREVLESAMVNADVIHVMLPFTLGKAAARYAAQNHIPLTAGFHCQAENITSHLFLQHVPIVSWLVYRILNRRLFRVCDCIHYHRQPRRGISAAAAKRGADAGSDSDPHGAWGMRAFMQTVYARRAENNCLAIYPEAHVWPFYTGIRPFADTSFRYPVQDGSPVVAMVTTYRKRTGLFRLCKRPGMTITFSEPMGANPGLSPKKAQAELRDRVYGFMVRVSAEKENVAYIRYEPLERPGEANGEG